MAGSTHEGEEEHLLEVYRRLAERHPGLQLVVAPRYVERAGPDHGAGGGGRAGRPAAQRRGRRPGARRWWCSTPSASWRPAYRLATLVFVGGSFVTRGGQNILEPAAQGKPVLFGPHMENFQDSVQVLLGRGGLQVRTPEQLFRVADELLSRPDQLAELGALARRAVTAIRGASARNVDHMLAVLPREAEGPGGDAAP